MDNYEVLEVIHSSKTSETIILKVKEKNKRICDKVYALKLIGSLNNRFQKLIFKREVDALKALNSCDSIVKIRDYMLNAEFRGKNDWGLILLDYVDGTNLEELDLSNFSQMEKYELCLKILKAIEEAHNNNVLHRDIKPSNIMYNSETGKVKIIDFGTSKIKSIIEQETTLPFYSPNFSAPEVVKGNSTTEASDIYSLGAIIFYILFDMLPNGTEMICRTLKELEIPENLENLIIKMVAEEPENRFQEIGKVIDVFEDIVGENGTQKDTYLCSVDIDKLRYLKNISLIEANANMTIFTKSFLKGQFKECSAFYNSNKDLYVFSGKKIAIECVYNEQNELFVVSKIVPLSVDRRISNRKRGFAIDGIDIMAVNKKNDSLLLMFKSEIIEQIRKRKVLKNTFVRYGLRKAFLGIDLEENGNMKNDLQKYRRNKGSRDELEPIIEKEILSDRKLLDEEFEVLIKYFADKCESFRINIYHLDDWAKSEWCGKVLSVLYIKKLLNIGYAECYDFRKALSIIRRTMPECSRDKIVQIRTDCYFSIVFDEKYIITGVPKDIVIMDGNTHIHKVEFYLQAI